MKTNPLVENENAGYALVTVLVLSSVGFMLLGGAMSWMSSHSIATERNNEYRTAEAAAEAACEKTMGRMLYDYKIGGQTLIAANLSNYETNVPTASEHPVWSNFEFSNALGTTNRTYARQTTAFQYTNLVAPYAGLMGQRGVYRVISNARQINTRYKPQAAIQQDIWVSSIPVFQFAIFYQGDLEFNSSTAMTVAGNVHCNGDIWACPGATLTLNGNVSATGRITHTRHPNDNNSCNPATINYNGTKITNAPSLTLPIGTNQNSTNVIQVIKRPFNGEDPASPLGQERYYNKAELLVLLTNNVSMWFPTNMPLLGTTNHLSGGAATRGMTNLIGLLGGQNNVSLSNYVVVAAKTPGSASSNVVAIIGTPGPSLNFTNAQLLSLKPTNVYFIALPGNHYGTNWVTTNFGGVNGNAIWSYGVVTNLKSLLTAGNASSYSTLGNYHMLGSNCFINLTNSFVDQRESNKWVRAVDIDIGLLTRWSTNNPTMQNVVMGEGFATNNPLNLIYVSDRRTNFTGFGSGANLYAVRLTNAGTLGVRGLTVATENPLYTLGNFNNSGTWRPASLISDSLTVLSANWNDTTGAASYTTRGTTATTINAALITGIVPTSVRYSGGSHNYPRFLENWNGNAVNLLGSMVSLYNSAIASNVFININLTDSYYSAPSRNFSFDTRFQSAVNLPPGTPEARVLIVDKWTPAAPNRTNYVAQYY